MKIIHLHLPNVYIKNHIHAQHYRDTPKPSESQLSLVELAIFLPTPIPKFCFYVNG